MKNVRHGGKDWKTPEAGRLRAGKYVARLRKAAGMTQRELADKAGLPYYTFVSQIECGTAKLPHDLIERFADALGVERVDFAKQLLAFYDPYMSKALFGVSVAKRT